MSEQSNPSAEPTIVQRQAANYEQLKDAFRNGRTALLEATEVATGKKVALLCALNRQGQDIEFIPFAKFIDGDPYEQFLPPDGVKNTDDGEGLPPELLPPPLPPNISLT